MNRLFQALIPVAVYWVQRFWILKEFSWKWTDEDQALLAYAVREIQAGHFREPAFYGQSYGNWIEALFAALITPQTLSPTSTLPWVTQSFFWLPFAVLAFWVSRSRRPLCACRALWILWLPCLLSVRADLLYSMPRAWIPGVSLCFLGWVISEWLREHRPKTSALLLGVGSALGTSLNSAAALLALPLVLERGIQRRDLRSLTVGLALGSLHGLGVRLFYQAHPNYSLHPSPTWEGTLQQLTQGLQSFDLFFAAFSPIAPQTAGWILTWGALMVLAWRSLPSKRGLYLLVAISGLTLTLLALSLNKVWDGSSSVLFPYERAFVSLPYFIAWGIARLNSTDRPNSFATKRLVPLLKWAPLILLALKTFSHPNQWEKEISQILNHGVVAPRAITALESTCQNLMQTAQMEDSRWVVFLEDRTLAYFCGMQWHGQLATLYPHYERRTWRLLEDSKLSPSSDSKASLLLVSGNGENSRRIPLQGQSPIDILRAEGVSIRPF